MLTGPTASGKTELALEVAESWGGVILSADAMQVYRGMDVGTAKVPLADRQRVPHRGVDVVNPDEDFDAQDFVALVDEALGEGRPVIVAGGTSLYVHAMRRGLAPTPKPDPVLRGQLEGLPDAHAELMAVDPVLAARLHPNDRLRIVRGLEVHAQTGRRLSDLHAEHAAAPDRIDVVGWVLDRDDLDSRIDGRAEAMFANGYVEEVQRLLDAGYGPELKPMRSLGYRHVVDLLLNGLPLDEALRRTQRDSRRFARKQRTWANALHLPVLRTDHREQVRAAAVDAFGEPSAST